MKLIIRTPDETRSLDISTMPIRDASDCERLTGMTWVEWREALTQDRALAVQFAWWLAGKRDNLTQPKFSDIDLDLATLRWDVELSEAEQAAVDAATPEAGEPDARPTGSGQEGTPTG
jgi:hypothetical protein